jgi:tRNA threonylcarbamoyl adenosine modification protein (Sua5/YciO/YrdC/YwlC family)
MLLKAHPKNPQPRVLEKAAVSLKEGNLVVIPTDTGYSFIVDLFNVKAVGKLYEIKKKEKNHQFSCLCYDFSQLSEYAQISNYAYKAMRHHLPGPYTFILEGTPVLPKKTLTRRRTIGVRMPDCPVCENLFQAFGGPLLIAAVPDEDRMLNRDAEELHKRWRHIADIVVDAGPVGDNGPTSIIDLTGETPVIVREGQGDLSWFK